MTARDHETRKARLGIGVGLAVAMLLVIAAGSLGLQRWVATTKTAAVLLSVVWAGLAVLLFLVVARRRKIRLIPVVAALAVGGLVAGGAYWNFSIRDTVVDEEVAVASADATGAAREMALRGHAGKGGDSRSLAADAAAQTERQRVEVAEGAFTGADGHSGTGTATVVQLASGERRLTFTDFDVDPGAAVEVYLVPGDGSDVSDRVELGALKGNVGDQEYELPAGVDLRRYRTVVLWCTPFTVRIAVAPLS